MHDENAKAVQEVAKTTDTGLKLADKVGSFIARICGDAFSQLGGMTSDQVKLWRYKQLLSIQDKVDAIHRQRGIEGKTIPIPLKLGLPIIEAASLEDDESLQELWAKLIANAMDPDYAETIHPAYIDIIKQLSGDEAIILGGLRGLKDYPIIARQESSYTETVGSPLTYYKGVCAQLSLKEPKAAPYYLDNLLRLRLLEFVIAALTYSQYLHADAHQDASVYKVEVLKFTLLGERFIRACLS